LELPDGFQVYAVLLFVVKVFFPTQTEHFLTDLMVPLFGMRREVTLRTHLKVMDVSAGEAPGPRSQVFHHHIAL
jgi:hypothetical protein